MSIVLVVVVLGSLFLLWGVYLCIILLLPIAGYSFGRVFAKMIGVGSASDEQFGKEVDRLVTCVALYVALFFVMFFLQWVVYMTGALDGPG